MLDNLGVLGSDSMRFPHVLTVELGWDSYYMCSLRVMLSFTRYTDQPMRFSAIGFVIIALFEQATRSISRTCIPRSFSWSILGF